MQKSIASISPKIFLEVYFPKNFQTRSRLKFEVHHNINSNILQHAPQLRRLSTLIKWSTQFLSDVVSHHIFFKEKKSGLSEK